MMKRRSRKSYDGARVRVVSKLPGQVEAANRKVWPPVFVAVIAAVAPGTIDPMHAVYLLFHDDHQ